MIEFVLFEKDIMCLYWYTRWRLFRAAQCGHYHRVARLLRAGAVDVNVRDRFRETPLMVAVDKGYTAVVNLLLQYGADPNAQNRDGVTPLFIAVHQHPHLIRILTQYSAHLEYEHPFWHTYLLYAIQYNPEAVYDLLDAGADPNHCVECVDEAFSRSPRYLVPLIEAMEHGDMDTFRLLLEHHADPRITDGRSSVYHIARTNRQNDAMELLKIYDR